MYFFLSTKKKHQQQPKNQNIRRITKSGAKIKMINILNNSNQPIFTILYNS